MARAQAARAGAREALMVNDKGCVAEATSSNVFWISDDALLTPSLGSGALAGITRGVVLEIAAGLGIRAVEGEITPANLQEADGVFLTNSGQGLVEVGEIDGWPVARSELVQKLKVGYRELVRKELSRDLS